MFFLLMGPDFVHVEAQTASVAVQCSTTPALVRRTFAEAGAEVVAEGAAGSGCSAPRA